MRVASPNYTVHVLSRTTMGPVLGVRAGLSVLRAPAATRPVFIRYVSSGSTRYFDPIKQYTRRHVEHYMPVVQQRLVKFADQWNTFTGYNEIQHLKSVVTEKQNTLQKLQADKRNARQVYIHAVVQRTASQRKTNDLLSRRQTWNDNDLAEYTRILHAEHSLAKTEEQSHQEFERAEAEEQRGIDELMHAVMKRYHEEHIWSDRVRSVSTYASFALAVVNGAWPANSNCIRTCSAGCGAVQALSLSEYD